MITIGQDIGGGVLVVSLDMNNRILAVKTPVVHDEFGTPLTITFGYGQDIDMVRQILGI